MAAPAAAAEGPADKASGVPEWMNGCDLLVCKVLQELSAQIVTNCRSFSAELQGVCSEAKEKLPADEPGKSDGNGAFDCADACFSFLENFGMFSRALLQLAGDLETAVTQPLQKTITTMMEESLGRMKHWQQVRSRFTELQDRYCRSRQKSLEARKLLASSPSESEKRWTWQRSSDGRVASEQHAAMRELAQCEEELLQSEASLRELEDQSRERLRQLESEKRALLRGALAQGTGLLKRLLPGTEKVAAPPTSDDWQGVVPRTTPRGEAEGRSWLEPLEEASGLESPMSNAGGGAGTSATSPGPSASSAAPERLPEESKGVPADPSAKYLQRSGMAAEFSELKEVAGAVSDDSDAEATDAAVRAVGWSPQTKPPSVVVPRKQRSLVFQSSGPSLVAESSVHGKDPFFMQSSPKPSEAASASSPVVATRTTGTPSAATMSACSNSSPQRTVSTSPAAVGASTDKRRHTVQLPQGVQGCVEEEDSDDSEPAPPLDAAVVALEISPLVAEDPRRCFERYVQRLHPRLTGATETVWERLQAKASEHILGGHVGKLEFFWIHRPGVQASPESSDGLVCFQFVQGAACNYSRVLHLSVADAGDTSRAWKALLPSAIFEVRRFLFGTLPIDSVRAMVLVGQDGNGPIFVDSDVEVAYQRCRFRWFQLTQNLQRTRGSLVSRQKVRLTSRFLVLHAMRGQADPRAPHSDIGRLPALLLRSEPASEGAATDGQLGAPAESGDGFSSW